MADHDFRGPTLSALIEELGSDRPTPGGGTGAALAGAMGAALVRMLAVLTLGRPRYAEHQALMEAVAEEAGAAAQSFLDLAAEDASAYDAVSAAYKLPKADETQRAARDEAIQQALRGAIEVPLRVMERCAEVIGLARNAVERGNRNAVSDGAAGAELCRAAMKVAAYNVKINLAAVKDEAYAKLSRTRMDEMLYMGQSVATVIDSQVNDLWKA